MISPVKSLTSTTTQVPILRFPTRAERDGLCETGSDLRLRDYYRSFLLPDLDDVAPRSLGEDRWAIAKWERYTGNPPLSEIDEETGNECLKSLIRGMEADAMSPATINKTWRELKGIFRAAFDDGFCSSVPVLLKRRKGKRIRSRLVKEPPKLQREIVTEEELLRLWRSTRYATYPAREQFPAPRYWRVALVLFWTYGARTIDFLQNLRWEHVRFKDRLLQFTAQKTSKLQGLPLTDAAIAHLKSIQGYSERVFPGFNSRGCFLKTPQAWKRGYYATWRAEICPPAQLEVPITLKHFRERVLTTYNAISPGLGSWILAHYMPGVSAQNYDLPTNQIRDLICGAPVPEFFSEVG